MDFFIWWKNQEDAYSDPLRIRAHHILCIQGFQGLGYSEEFTKNDPDN